MVEEWLSELASQTVVEVADSIASFRVWTTCKSEAKKLHFMITDFDVLRKFHVRMTTKDAQFVRREAKDISWARLCVTVQAACKCICYFCPGRPPQVGAGFEVSSEGL